MSNELATKSELTHETTSASTPVSVLEKMNATPISRRNLLGMAGQGILGMGLLALLGGGSAANAAGRTRLERMLPGVKELKRPTASQPIPGMNSLLAATSLSFTPSLPMWGDGQNFNQPQYYETLCVGDVDGDGQDELIVRGPAGILVEQFDPQLGQWTTLTTAGPVLSDAAGWDQPKYYQTIQCTDVDGDGQAEIVARGPNGLVAYHYNNTTKKFTALQTGQFFGDSDDNSIWTQESHYATIKWGKVQAPGYGLQWVIGRHSSGIVAHYYAAEIPGWFEPYFGYGPWPDTGSDGTTWTLPQYYETIQMADVDGDGQEELLGRSASGIEVYKFSTTTNTWQLFINPANSGLKDFSDVNGWAASASYYRTIQCADIDGDGKAEILARSVAGIAAYHYQTDSNGNATFVKMAMSNAPNFIDTGGWTSESRYSTIQFGDIDGDGSDELIARDWGGITTWKYFPIGEHATQWIQIGGSGSNIRNPAWTDDGTDSNGNAEADSNNTSWDEVQYYSTIRLARTHPDPLTYYFPSPNTAPIYNGSTPLMGPYATLIGRDKYGIQTWRYHQNNAELREDGGYWIRATHPQPDFNSVPSLAAAYVALDTALRGSSNATGNIRDVYNNQETHLDAEDGYMGKLYDDPDSIYGPYVDGSGNPLRCKIPTPSGVDDTAWQHVTWHIYWEMAYVTKVNDWFYNKMSGLIDSIAIGKILTVKTVGDMMNIPDNSNTTVVLSILSLVFNAGWAILGFPGIADAESEFAALPGTLSGISGLMSTVFGAGALASSSGGGGSWQGAYSQLEIELSNAFTEAGTNNSTLNQAVTGGANGLPAYQPGDFGMMAAIGQQIMANVTNGAWTWPTSTGDVANQVAHGYAIQIWQTIMPAAGWAIGYASDNSVRNPTYPYSYPGGNSNSKFNPYWLVSAGPTIDGKNNFAPNQDQLWGTAKAGDIWPLGIPQAEVFNAQNGWPALGYYDFAQQTPLPPIGLNPPLPSTSADMRLIAELKRNAVSGAIEAVLRIENHGLGAATNVEIASAQLGNRVALAPLPQKRTRLADGKTWTTTVTFPINAAQVGQTVVLRIQGTYKGGTFGGSYRLKMP